MGQWPWISTKSSCSPASCRPAASPRRRRARDAQVDGQPEGGRSGGAPEHPPAPAHHRKLSLTDVGRIYYDYCARIAGESRTPSARSPACKRRRAVSCASPRVRQRHLPRPRSSATTSSATRRSASSSSPPRAVDLVEERFDLGHPRGRAPDSTLIARSLGRVAWFLVATPAYLKRRDARGHPPT